MANIDTMSDALRAVAKQITYDWQRSYAVVLIMDQGGGMPMTMGAVLIPRDGKEEKYVKQIYDTIDAADHHTTAAIRLRELGFPVMLYSTVVVGLPFSAHYYPLRYGEYSSGTFRFSCTDTEEERAAMYNPELKAQVTLSDMLKLWEETNISGDTMLRAMCDITKVRPSERELLLRMRVALTALMEDVDAGNGETEETSRWPGIHALLKECARVTQRAPEVKEEKKRVE